MQKALEARRHMAASSPPMAADAAQSAAVAAKSPQVLLAQLKAKLLALAGRVVDLREDPFTQVSGVVIAANERWAAMHIGRETQLVDRHVWPVEEGRSYQLREGVPMEVRPVDSRAVSALEYVYGKQVGEQARQWAERDKVLVNQKSRDNSLDL